MTLAHGKAAHIVQAIGITSPYGASKAVSLGFFGPIPHQPKWELSVESEMQLLVGCLIVKTKQKSRYPSLHIPKYVVDVLWGQRIKLAQVASTSELLENQWNDLVFFKITLISMIKKMPNFFWMLKSKLVMTYFMFVLLRPCRNDREQFQRKERHSVDFQAILK